ncbi:alpha/beta hydrolase [Saccharopolyspora elongata]|uniref:Alpha/beta hydrolase n=1 Tax=Saccharopolyspora elongata TaxID=2530387 RepID=A0A4R4YA26_9PSEU|nr:alpha/beta hydrolase [Saccharopolyspora elongata]TDD41263.1 alpha/beta hydrolase [Saccharopolyspora elongata]
MSDPNIDAAYNVRNTVSPEVFDHVIAEYRRLSQVAVEGLRGFTGVAYDPLSEQKLDIWGVGQHPRPVFVVIHGGYWRMLAREDTAFMAGVLADAGVATVSIDYGLAPGTPIEEMVRQVRTAIAHVHRYGHRYGLDPERITVGGSSAGGHLAACTMVAGWQQQLGLPDDVVKAALPISGLFDLRPLVTSFANEWLGLDLDRAAAASPMCHAQQSGPPALIAVAEHDGTGFSAQSARFHQEWAEHSPSELFAVPGRNHYDVFLDLADPDSALTAKLLALIEQSGARRRSPLPQDV